MKRFSDLKTGSNVKFGEEIHVSTTQVGRYLKNHSIVDDDGHVYIRTSTSDMTRQALRNIMDGGKRSLVIGDLVRVVLLSDTISHKGYSKGNTLPATVEAITENGIVFSIFNSESFLDFNDFNVVKRIF